MVKMEDNKKSCHADLVLNAFRSMMPGNEKKTRIVTFRVAVKGRRIQRYDSIVTFLYALGVQLPKTAFGFSSRLL